MPERLVERVEYICLRCGHHWFAAGPRPRACGKCKNTLWDKPRQIVKKGKQ